MRIMREETFGPVLPIMAVPSLDEAIRLANDSDYGSRPAVDARSRRRRAAWSGSCRRGRDHQRLRLQLRRADRALGGVKQSGIGRTHGVSGLREMVQVKYVAARVRRRADLWWYPYGAEFHRFMSTANRALHARSSWTRLPRQLRLLASAASGAGRAWAAS
jgi:succinate-semialdehyde dehydrogenase/glutarate-semialdehyde dehydrogenase